MSQVPRKLPEEEEGDEEEEEEEEIVGLAGYADGAESFSDGDAESGGDEACECHPRRPQRRRGAAPRPSWGCRRRQLLPGGRGVRHPPRRGLRAAASAGVG